ncbi:MAG: hypothetical protein ACP5KI_05025 [Brevinematia bacterium]
MFLRFIFTFILVFLVSKIYPVQFEFVEGGVKSIASGGTGVSFVKDPFSISINPANLAFEKNTIDLYYEAYSFVNINNFLELYNKRFVFDPASVGASFKVNEFSRIGFLYSSYIYDFDYPEILYKTFLFAYSGRFSPYIYGGISTGPVVALSDFSKLFSFLVNLGFSFKFYDTTLSFSARSPFSINYFSPIIGEVSQFFPPNLSFGANFPIYQNVVILCSFSYLFLNSLSAKVENREVFVARTSFFDNFSFRFGGVYYDYDSGYRIMVGFYKSSLETLSISIPQYHLTLGATFFIRIPGLNNDFEVNFAVDDLTLLNFLNIAPLNFRKISIYVGFEVRV